MIVSLNGMGEVPVPVRDPLGIGNLSPHLSTHTSRVSERSQRLGKARRVGQWYMLVLIQASMSNPIRENAETLRSIIVKGRPIKEEELFVVPSRFHISPFHWMSLGFLTTPDEGLNQAHHGGALSHVSSDCDRTRAFQITERSSSNWTPWSSSSKQREKMAPGVGERDYLIGSYRFVKGSI